MSLQHIQAGRRAERTHNLLGESNAKEEKWLSYIESWHHYYKQGHSHEVVDVVALNVLMYDSP